jgi:hypothetical protein
VQKSHIALVIACCAAKHLHERISIRRALSYIIGQGFDEMNPIPAGSATPGNNDLAVRRKADRRKLFGNLPARTG